MDNLILYTSDKRVRNFLLQLAFLNLAILMLAGCGGSSNSDNPFSSSDEPSPSTNKPPVAVNDNASTKLDKSVDINVIQNYSDEDGTIDGSTVTISKQPTGSVINKGDGTITYQ